MIYFVQDDASHRIKIGLTNKSVRSRLSTLQTACPGKLTLLLEIQGDREKEKQLHDKFGAYRIQGEWFIPSPIIIEHIILLSSQKLSSNLDFKGKFCFYFAGKISENGWRDAILGSDFCTHITNQDETDSNRLPDWKVRENRDGFFYAGPYFIGEDMGHGMNEWMSGYEDHGFLVNASDGNHGTNRPLVCQNCLTAIDNSNVVFCWIDAIDCYGTVAEIGYARAKGKKIWIAGPHRYPDMWFIYEMADLCLFDCRNAHSALKQCIAIHAEYNQDFQKS